ncbi:CvpA family protein [Lactiplantibacillus mudanjiangensis]|uniref:Bacteriocin transporter [Lactobacillus pentosus] n=1 Tax=Lactiplantibacillus mudanjiangensis TaxID=1296538 RepID=A0A660DVS1_9LACO|nr:CvpA family protein [Lactiplantibacillus mudanjiangensis]VDG20385.1 bacteriocin transporter [Lactobacillus pentosus] [Lactiplantibacillus mudanjiangensis]VDG23919.1 bacteriocin transporter [Lactobacillus pentosus] [Lactiplantibacillus mudanjiangensis]VDG27092.1 bacteriocin transporter [Lactobacillus pentosus] [Lactiplantibacillus mudanjiangensis]VDG34000.1 bacteriocin transporter [Lactobacillus pentosus] [Lactiplantibacillus mudanjiangensis]
MIFTIVILLLLVGAIFRGFHRGFVIEILHLIGTIGVLIFARLLYQPLGTTLASLLTSLNLVKQSAVSTLVINLVAFFILTSLGWAVIRMLARVSRAITWLPVIKQVNSLAGGAVSFVISYLVIFVVLSLANLVQTDFIQTQMSNSPVATFIVKQTPGLTSQYLGNVFKFETGTQNS